VLVWTLMQVFAVALAGGGFPDYIDRYDLLQQALIGVGWTAGLWLSGFPRLMQDRGVAAPSSAPASQGPD
jgi:hypothetical protein